jgi:membrane protein
MLMYRWIPNRHIAWRFAALGGLVAAILFELSKRAFTMYLAWFPTHEVIYGAVALLPLMMIWLHLVWAIILLGAETSFSYEEYCQSLPSKAP